MPVSRVPDPAAAPPLKWGGDGAGLDRLTPSPPPPDVHPPGVGRRLAQFVAGQEFAGSSASRRTVRTPSWWPIPNVEAVYIASPHSEHAEQMMLAIEAGKHVLVEKAFTRNAAEARRVVDAAREHGVA